MKCHNCNKEGVPNISEIRILHQVGLSAILEVTLSLICYHVDDNQAWYTTRKISKAVQMDEGLI